MNNKMRHRSISVIIAVCLMFLFPIYNHAYLEPGTLTYVIQVIVAVFVGVMVSLRFFGSKVKQFFKKLLPGKNKNNTD